MMLEPGAKVGRLTLVQVVARKPNIRWECLCSCGAVTMVYQPNLRCGRVQSCGCLRKEMWRSRRKTVVQQNGYSFVRTPLHPRANPRTGRVREHILVMESILGRPLLPGEEVHHKNAIRSDNRPENLELWVRGQPAGARATDVVEWAVQILNRYAPELLKR